MAIKSGLFNSVNGDRRYKADFFAEYFASFIANGVFPNPSTGLQVIASTGMAVNIKAGKAWIKGYYFANDADYTLQLDVADGVLKRIDRIVLRLDFLDRQIVPLVKKGLFASTPVAPALQRDADAYEIALADILVSNGVISISQANITDLRLNTALCGIVHGTVQQVDTTTLFNQYQSWFGDFTEDKQADFEEWLDALKDILDGDVAANLATRISSLEDTVATHLADETTHGIGDKSTLLTTDKTSIVSAMNELFTNANNGKTDIASVIGSPATSGDTFAQLKTHIQNSKNDLATNLTAKGQSSVGTETLDALVDKVALVNTGKKWASGTFSNTGPTQTRTISGLAFVPKLILVFGRNTSSGGDSTTVSYILGVLGENGSGYKNWITATNMGGYIDTEPTGTSFSVYVPSGTVTNGKWFAYE